MSQTPKEAIAALSLTMESYFIPWSKSRNAKQKHPSLNWRVVILHNQRPFIETQYMAGCAHCPAYKNAKGNRGNLYDAARIKTECEKGFAVQPNSEYTINHNAPIVPKIEDVLYSLVMDSDAIEYATYEDWADNMGVDKDSRKGERMYKACLDTALRLRCCVGDTGLAQLREAFQDY